MIINRWKHKRFDKNLVNKNLLNIENIIVKKKTKTKAKMKIVKMKILFKVGDLLSAKESIPTI